MKQNTDEESGHDWTTDKTTDTPSTLFEDMSPVDPDAPSAKPGVILKLYGMNLLMDEAAGKLIITNSILKNAPAGNLIEIQENE